MNRKQRRAMGLRGPQVWTQPVTCLDCGAELLHVEIGDGQPDDEPQGLPPLPCDECGGALVAARRDPLTEGVLALL